MRSRFTYGAATLALLVSVTCTLAQSPSMNMKRDSGFTLPQAQFSLSADQKQAIWNSVAKNKSAMAPANFQASVGANVPAQIALRPLPSTLSKQVPDIKKYRYAKIADEVVLVDPSTHKVIDVIKQ